MSDSEADWARLGDVVRSRREELGLTQTQVQDLGGPSAATQRAVENDRASSLSPGSRHGLERALCWSFGSVDSVLGGGDPHVVDRPPFVEVAPPIAQARTPRDVRVERLGEVVKLRREQMGFTQMDIARAGGPSDTTLTGIENGTAMSIGRQTFQKLDAALEWPSGTAWLAFHGGDPGLDNSDQAPPAQQDADEPHLELSEVLTLLAWHANEAAKIAFAESRTWAAPSANYERHVGRISDLTRYIGAEPNE